MQANTLDFNKWEKHASGLTMAQLEYIVLDCRAACKAMRGHNPDKENYYSDQAATYASEARKRLKRVA